MSRLGLHDGLAVQFQQQAEDPVGGGVLRPHVQDASSRSRVVNSSFAHALSSLVLVAVLVAVDRVVLAQRVAFPILRAS